MLKLSFLLSCLLVPFFCSSQNAAEILANYTEATGGQAAWDNVETMHVSGTAELVQQQMTLPFSRVLSIDGRQLTQLIINGMTYTETAFDGHQAWGTDQFMQAAKKTEEETENIRRRKANFPYPAHNWQQKDFLAEYLDTVRIEERLCHQIRLTKKPELIDGVAVESHSTLYIDATTFFLILTEEEVSSGPMQGQIMRAIMTDYQEVDGLWYPFKTTLSYGEQVFQLLQTEEVIFNQEVEEGIFNFPE